MAESGAPLYLGLDAGTSVTKAAVFDAQGREIAVAERRTAVSRLQPGWSEIDPHEAWEASCAVLREVLENAGVERGAIRSLGLSSAMIGAWVLDGEGQPLRAAITWEDSRSQSLIDELSAEDPSFHDAIFASSGCVLQTGCTLPVLAWLARHEPEVLRQAHYVISFKDYLRFRLTGEIATDRTEAAVIPGSTRQRTRSDDMIALFGLQDCAGLLPPVADSESVAGLLNAEAADQTGLPEGLPVAVGAGDVPSTMIGAGAARPGSALAVLGTACMVGVVHDQPVFEPPGIGLLFPLPGKGWYRAMANAAGTHNLDWAFATLAPDLADRDDRFTRLDAMLDDTPIGASGLSYLPFLSDSGIIAPIVDPRARAQFTGLAPRHTRAHMFRAVIEGVAFAMADLLKALSFQGSQMLLTGGGAGNNRWVQMICDLIDKPVHVPQGSQFGARGAAWLGAVAVGDYPSVQAAAEHSLTGRLFEPSAADRSALGDAYARYREVRSAHVGRFPND
ncbi:FGGY-family carbohydrate kinase [Hoeflea poritis]|uniref:Carbohydrate kinase n=1 Tax=Hoeflea poritis TaxID=2993659 RepID=A0ABT4VUV4_9HYPH|nr:FGGY-family carbohydrate kinase [Hoeflea poritis]MDA4848488.1 carbohydrate kinase [Hoeflea poritis]